MRPFVLAAVLLGACGAQRAPARPGPTAEPAPEPARAPEGRVLAARRTFGDLVALARARVDDAGRASGEACILRAIAGGSLELAGDLALSIRPLPDPADSLAMPLAASPHEAGLLSLFGFEGRGPVLIAAFTPMPPPSRAGAVVIVLTNEGAYVRGTGRVAPTTTRAPVEALGHAVAPMLEAGASPIVIGAEADVPVEALDGALAALAELDAPVALGVPLAPGVDSPRALAPSEAPPAPDARRCAPEVSARPPELARLRAALAPLGERVRACRRGTSSADAARGGIVRLRLHAREDGRVREACASSDEVGDATLLRCIEGGAMALALPPSSGAYAVELPIRLARDASFDRAPRCPPR